MVRHGLRERAGWQKRLEADWSDAQREPDDRAEPPELKEVQRIAALMTSALQEVGDTKQRELARHSVLVYAFGRASTKELTTKEVRALGVWLELEPGAYEPNETAAEECRRMYRAHLEASGQAELGA